MDGERGCGAADPRAWCSLFRGLSAGPRCSPAARGSAWGSHHLSLLPLVWAAGPAARGRAKASLPGRSRLIDAHRPAQRKRPVSAQSFEEHVITRARRAAQRRPRRPRPVQAPAVRVAQPNWAGAWALDGGELGSLLSWLTASKSPHAGVLDEAQVLLVDQLQGLCKGFGVLV